MNRVLVTGGAGYVGSHVVLALVRAGWEVHVLDDLSTGKVSNLAGLMPGIRFHRGACGRVAGLLASESIAAVIHCAGRRCAPESVGQPTLYLYGLEETLRVARACAETQALLVFSSSCSVYGNKDLATESDPTDQGLSLYAELKAKAEQCMIQLARAGLGVVILRYFNAAGAAMDGAVPGVEHDYPLPSVFQAAVKAAFSRGPELQVFGADWPTRDGTCIRDYVHVDDLARAHVLAIELAEVEQAKVFNLGSGTGSTVLEVIQAVGRAAGKPVPYSIAPRRQGDPGSVVANPQLAAEVLGWTARLSLDDCAASAAAAYRRHWGQ